jgi:hypothetical protein
MVQGDVYAHSLLTLLCIIRTVAFSSSKHQSGMLLASIPCLHRHRCTYASVGRHHRSSSQPGWIGRFVTGTCASPPHRSVLRVMLWRRALPAHSAALRS